MTARLIALGLILSSAALAQGHCPSGYSSLGANCYIYVDQRVNWAAAEATCIAMGGSLAELLTADEGKFVHDLAKNNHKHDVWLGANNLLVQGLWTWATSGKALAYTDWGHDQPQNNPLDDENCMSMEFDHFGGHWNDEECEHPHRFICQRPASVPTL